MLQHNLLDHSFGTAHSANRETIRLGESKSRVLLDHPSVIVVISDPKPDESCGDR
jgi:hypothetical protein